MLLKKTINSRGTLILCHSFLALPAFGQIRPMAASYTQKR